MSARIGDYFYISINQGEREAEVLATIGEEYMIEYLMPAGTSALAILSDGPDGKPNYATYRSVSYLNVPKKWLKALVEAGVDWIGTPQSISDWFRKSGGRVPSPKEMLEAREAKKEWTYWSEDPEGGYRGWGSKIWKSGFTEKQRS